MAANGGISTARKTGSALWSETKRRTACAGRRSDLARSTGKPTESLSFANLDGDFQRLNSLFDGFARFSGPTLGWPRSLKADRAPSSKPAHIRIQNRLISQLEVLFFT